MGFKLTRRAVCSLAVLLAGTMPAVSAPLLWRVSDDDSHIHLFGSVHNFVSAETNWRTEQFDDILKTAEYVYFEAYIRADEDLESGISALIAAEGRLPAELSLSTSLTSQQYERVSAALDAAGYSPSTVQGLQPWVVQWLLLKDRLRNTPPSATLVLGVENTVGGEVAPSRMRSLETPEQQLRALLGIVPPEDQVESLMAWLDSGTARHEPGKLNDLIAGWVAGNLDIIEREIETYLAFDSDVYRRLIADRNARWVAAIDRMLAENESSLVIVGVGHMTGPDSLLVLLVNNGYAVELETRHPPIQR